MTTFMTFLPAILIFIAVFLVIETTMTQVLVGLERGRRSNRRIAAYERGKNSDEVRSSLLKAANIPAVTHLPLRRILRRLDIFRQQAGINMSLARIFLLAGSAAAASVLFGGLLLVSAGHLTLLNIVLTSFGGVTLPALCAFLWMSSLRRQRLRKIDEQLPTALDILIRALRAGHPVISALNVAATELQDPLGTEFGLVVDEASYGIEFAQALKNFAARVGSPECHFFALSVGIQNYTGGNLIETLRIITTIIRSRSTLGRKVKSLSSEGKATGLLIAALVPITASGLFVINPTFYSDKVSDHLFVYGVVAGAATYFAGITWIYKIVNFKY